MTTPIDLLAPTGAAYALLPELLLSAAAMVVLLVVAWRHTTAQDSRLAGWLSVGGLGLSAAGLAWLWWTGAAPAGLAHMVALDRFRYAGAALILFVSAGTVLFSLRYLQRQRLLAPEYYVLVLFATIGMLLMAAASDLVMVFLGLEVMSVAVYVLAGYDRFRRSSAEAAVKYFLMGAFASGFLLYGIALAYGATGTTNLSLIGERLAVGQPSLMAQVGLGLILVGFAFKVSAVPFHMWAPDVYDGAPTPVTGFMATNVKAAAFLALARILIEGFPTLADLWQPVIGVLAVATILVGNLVAIAQRSMKRLLAYSSVAHAGYILVAIWAGTTLGTGAVLLYLIAYCVTTFATFGVVGAMEHVGSRTVMIEDLEGLFSVRPWGALSLAVCLVSLLGFPGTFGFIGKWYILRAVIEQGQIVLPIAIVLGSLISAGYYLPVVTALTMKPTRTRESHRQVLFSRGAKLIIAGAVVANILFGVWPTRVIDAAEAGAQALTGAVAGAPEAAATVSRAAP